MPKRNAFTMKLAKKDRPRCVTCGAAAAYGGKLCDGTCSRAHKAGRTRAEQLAFELTEANPLDEQLYSKCNRCGQYASQCECEEGVL